MSLELGVKFSTNKKMGRTGKTTKMPSFCLNRIVRPTALARVRSQPPPPPPSETKKNASSVKFDDEENSLNSVSDHHQPATKVVGSSRIMIVMDSSVESKSALQWALTHTVQSQDLVILLYVVKKAASTNQGDVWESKKDPKNNKRAFSYLSSMKNMCKQKRPEVKVEVMVAEGKEKGPVIVEEANKAKASMLILGQKKHSMAWKLVMIWASNNIRNQNRNRSNNEGMVEYCIQNANCMAVAVRRKSKKLGGFLITTKRQKDFWLLA